MRIFAIIAASTAFATAVFAQALDAQTFSRGGPVPETMPLGSEPGDPTIDMPQGQALISPFGERPVFSPDGTKLAFIGKSYGDAFEYDLAEGKVRNLTGHAPSEGYLRVHYLGDGSVLLLGPRKPAATREETRLGRIEMFWLAPAGDKPPVAIGMQVWEGVATSRISNKVAWAQMDVDREAQKIRSTTLYTGRIEVAEGRAKLVDVEEVLKTTDCFVEAQDFLPGDRGLVMPCYRFGDYPGGARTEIVSFDFVTRKLTRYPTPEAIYGEVEGIFPDGKRTLVECAQDRSAGMDICVLDLEPARPRYTRMTDIVRFGRWKYGNPVVHPTRPLVAAQVGPADVIDAGVGQGIVLMTLADDF